VVVGSYTRSLTGPARLVIRSIPQVGYWSLITFGTGLLVRPLMRLNSTVLPFELLFRTGPHTTRWVYIHIWSHSRFIPIPTLPDYVLNRWVVVHWSLVVGGLFPTHHTHVTTPVLGGTGFLI